mgnify:CR=1 FL=1
MTRLCRFVHFEKAQSPSVDRFPCCKRHQLAYYSGVRATARFFSAVLHGHLLGVNGSDFFVFGSSLRALRSFDDPGARARRWAVRIVAETDCDRRWWTGGGAWIGRCVASDVEKMFEPAIEPVSISYGLCAGGDVELGDLGDAHESPQFIYGEKRSRSLSIGDRIPGDIQGPTSHFWRETTLIGNTARYLSQDRKPTASPSCGSMRKSPGFYEGDTEIQSALLVSPCGPCRGSCELV